MRAVLDTNVLVGAVIVRAGIPGQVLDHAEQRTFESVTSEPLLLEIETVLIRPHLQARTGWDRERILIFIDELMTYTTLAAESATSLSEVVRDEMDHLVLEAAIAGEADYIVSGDKDLLVLESYEGIQIVTPAQFLAILATAEM